MIELRYCYSGNHDFPYDLDDTQTIGHDDKEGNECCYDHCQECNPKAVTNSLVDWFRNANPSHYHGLNGKEIGA